MTFNKGCHQLNQAPFLKSGGFCSIPNSKWRREIMRVISYFFVLLLLLVVALYVAPNIYSSEVKQGDQVTIITPGTVARLCPYPNCGQTLHITRIPKGIVLKIERILDVKSGVLTVKWFEVTYQGKRGWISVFDTDKAQ